eukprot:TRINITY_DN57289_c0_g1_i1.p4 TRINITY_DN57289_c0_g1~~TRINITY_DN57289_c0_g1_i1.p4  ORF type:complete len:115 (-),score=14.83 TRINITY_DN57289_c0_g1_i1:110-454(-)
MPRAPASMSLAHTAAVPAARARSASAAATVFALAARCFASSSCVCANSRRRSPYGCWTPMHIASWMGQLGVAKMLVDIGAAVDAKNEYCILALYLAVDHGDLANVEMLVEGRHR